MQNGKGDKSRIGDIKKYRDNFSEIDWGKKYKCLMCNDSGYIEADLIECPCKKNLTKRKN